MNEPIAIVGIGCRFPGASGPTDFWSLLESGRSAIGPVPEWRWDASAWTDSKNPAMPGKMPTSLGGYLQDLDQFDSAFFGIPPEEARSIDPQQRLMLEVAWEAFEDAAIPPARIAGSDAAVFVGVSSLNYGSIAQLQPQSIDRYTNTGIGGAICANRLSYFFDLRGPSFSVDSACASSLLAVHLACRALWNGETKLALAGGVNAILLPGPGVGMARGGMMSPDGTPRVFDAEANGWVRGEGAAIVLLKPLSDAIASGDPIYATIRGTAVNQNGRSNGLSGPSRPAQELLLRQACASAKIDPASVGYVEAHSNATLIGDATELAALGNVLGAGRPAHRPLTVGSLKPNIGHLEAASGIASLIKVSLMLKRRRFAPTLNFRTPNPHAGMDRLPVRIAAGAESWDCEGERIAGVSAAGYGGANVHVLLGDAPARPEFASDGFSNVLALSAKSPDALVGAARQYGSYLATTAAPLSPICYTTMVGRAPMRHRLAIVGSDAASIADALKHFACRESSDAVHAAQVDPRRGAAPSLDPSADAATIARAFVNGADPAALHRPGIPRLGELPTYPFQRQRYWLEGTIDKPASISSPSLRLASEAQPAASPGRRARPDLPYYMPARNEVERRLVRVWEQTLNVAPIGIRDVFFDLGGTSALALQLFANMEREFGVALPLAKLYSAPNIENISPLLIEPDGPCKWDPIVTLNEQGTLPPLFFVPGLGGHAFDLMALARRIGDEQPICVLHPHGLDPGQVPLTKVEEMATAFLKHVRARQPHGPYRLGGYSFGASVAFEMAWQLSQAGESVASLVLLDGYAPAAFVKRSLARRVATHVQKLWDMNGSDRVQYLRDRMAGVWKKLRLDALGGAEAPQASAVADAVQRVTQENIVAWRGYRPRPYPGGALLLRARPSDAHIDAFCTTDPRNGWGRFCAAGVDVVELGCDHLAVFHEPYINVLAERIRASLESLRPRPQPMRVPA